MVRGEHQDDVIGSFILPDRKGILGEIRCSVFIYAKVVITWVISYFVKRHKKPGKANGLTQSLIFLFFLRISRLVVSFLLFYLGNRCFCFLSISGYISKRIASRRLITSSRWLCARAARMS